jgi:hypothetical protein
MPSDTPVSRSDGMAIENRPAGQGWRGGVYVVKGGKPLLGPFDSEEEAVQELASLKASKLFRQPT